MATYFTKMLNLESCMNLKGLKNIILWGCQNTDELTLLHNPWCRGALLS